MFSVWRECTILQLTQVRQTWCLVKIDYGNCDDDDDDDDDELGYSVLNLISGLTISSAASVVFVAQRIHNISTCRRVVDLLREELCNESTTRQQRYILACEGSMWAIPNKKERKKKLRNRSTTRRHVEMLWIRCTARHAIHNISTCRRVVDSLRDENHWSCRGYD